MKKNLYHGLLLSLFAFVFLPSAKSANVALFADETYTDVSANCFNEGYNVIQVLTSLGHTVTPFTGITSADFSAALAGQDILFFPEMEDRSLENNLSAASITVISNFVNAGGGLSINGTHTSASRPHALLNTIFGFTLANGGVRMSGSSALNAAEAVGTEFDGGPATLLNLNATNFLISSLPPGSKCIYENSTTRTTVALIPFGAGQIAYLGWDWFNGGLGCPLENADWNTVLNSAMVELSSATPPPAGAAVPTLGQWGLIILSLLMMSIVMVFSMAPKMATANGQTTPAKVTLQNFAFDKNTFFKMWPVVAAFTALGFFTAMNVFGYELTSADPIGGLVATGIVAYMMTKMKK